jgi:SAM-dependent methyltransferase
VPSPGAYLASYYDCVLASLAEVSAATPGAVELVRTFSEPYSGLEALRFGDDWVDSETGPVEDPPPVEGLGQGALVSYLRQTEGRGPEEVLLKALKGRSFETVLEVGCGAGCLAARLAASIPQLLVVDLSLRAVLLARRRKGPAEVGAAVADGDYLPLLPDSLDALVAANLVDLLEDPEAFLAQAARSLRSGGLLALSTPAPELTGGAMAESTLADLVRDAGFVNLEISDGHPWVRPHHPRHFEIYLVQVLTAEAR